MDTQEITFNWEYVNRHDLVKRAEFEKDGFTCLVEVHLDTDYDFAEFRGTFTNTWEPNAIVCPLTNVDFTCYKYFVPENTAEYHEKELLKQGKSPMDAYILAKQYEREDMLIAGTPEKMGYAAYGVTCEVSREMRQGARYVKKVVLGEAGLWGIEIGDHQYDSAPYIDECANEMVQEALEDAKRTLKFLQTDS